MRISHLYVHFPRFSLRRHELMSEHDFRTQHICQTQASSKMWHIAERAHIFQQHEQPGINWSQVVSKLQTLSKKSTSRSCGALQKLHQLAWLLTLPISLTSKLHLQHNKQGGIHHMVLDSQFTGRIQFTAMKTTNTWKDALFSKRFWRLENL